MNDDLEDSAGDVLLLSERVQRGHADVAVPLVEDREGHLDLGTRVPLRLATRMLLKGMPVPATPMRIDAAWAVMVAARADVLRSIPLPEAYFLYWEDFDWFYRLRRDGGRV